MTNLDARSAAAANQLHEAVLATRASDRWFRDQLQVLDLVQYSVAQWASDIASTFREIDQALALAEASPDKEEAPDHDPVGALEDALIGAVAVRDRLRSLAALNNVLDVWEFVTRHDKETVCRPVDLSELVQRNLDRPRA